MSTAATNVVLRLIRDVINHNDLALIDELVHPDFFSHATPPTRAHGRNGVASTVTALHRTYAAFRIEPRDVISTDDKIVVRATASGRHHHANATEAEWSAQQIHVFRIVDGQIVEHWVVCEQPTPPRGLQPPPRTSSVRS